MINRPPYYSTSDGKFTFYTDKDDLPSAFYLVSDRKQLMIPYGAIQKLANPELSTRQMVTKLKEITPNISEFMRRGRTYEALQIALIQLARVVQKRKESHLESMLSSASPAQRRKVYQYSKVRQS
jgi:hypothetical protein